MKKANTKTVKNVKKPAKGAVANAGKAKPKAAAKAKSAKKPAKK